MWCKEALLRLKCSVAINRKLVSFLEKAEKSEVLAYLRLIFPELDNSRKPYRVREDLLGSIYGEILQIPEEKKKMLKQWYNPSSRTNQSIVRF